MVRLETRYRVVVPGPGEGGDRADHVVAIAQDRLLGSTVVLKLASVGTAAAAELEEEGGRLVALGHPALLELTDRFTCEAQLGGDGELRQVTGFATRWVDGVPFDAAVRELAREAALARFARLLDVVDYLHRRGLIHLDIKSDNVLVDGDKVVLLDLGSARPLDAGPGEAGGTLGWAAPEVLLGEAASVAADMFSLGCLLYGLLAGRTPHTGLDGAELRRATLAGEVVPVRALAPDCPRPLAHLAERMLARRPSARPPSISAVQETLADAGIAVPQQLGDPPLVGRQSELDALTHLISQPRGGRVVVVGRTGVGRRRLVRTLFQSPHRCGGRLPVDLAAGPQPLRVVDGLAMLAGATVPDPETGAPWRQSMVRILSTWEATPPLLVNLGVRRSRSADLQRALDELVPAMVSGGARVVELAEPEDQVQGRRLELAPLSEQAVAELAHHYGVFDVARIGPLHRRSGGRPGVLVPLLSAPVGSASAAGVGAAVLAALPAGVPAAVVEALPSDLRAELQRTVERELASWDDDGRLYAQGRPTEGLSAGNAVRVRQAVLQLGTSAPTVWLGRAAVGLGLVDEARRWFSALDRRHARGSEGWRELVAAVAESGDRDAVSELASLHEERGELAAAVALLGGLPEPTEGEVLRLVRCLRRDGRPAEAEQALVRALAHGETGELWLERARLLLAQGTLEAALEACAEAERCAPALADGSALGLRASVALKQLARREEPPELDALLERIEGLADRLPSRTLSTAGRILTRTGGLQRGERLLALAAEAADREGDARAAAGIRLNRGNALQRLSRGRDARRAYRDALTIAEQAAAPALLLRIRYSLGDLELRSGRLPAAEVQVAAFCGAAEAHPSPEVRARAGELRARLLLAKEQPADALEVLESLEPAALAPDARIGREIGRATALLALGRPGEALPLLDALPPSKVPTVGALVASLRGRALVALGRAALVEARAAVPDEPDLLVRAETGAVLLATAGEDLDPSSFSARRRDLDTAARLLRGPAAARAATLRDRLLDGPGANLEGVVALTESMDDPQAFPSALARLVSEALGAYRVLIMLRIPGLGRQMTYSELSGTEAAGIGSEVLRHVRKADDFWLAHNAFADPHLRRTSQTVRTFELKSLLAVAIPRGDEAIGALYVDDLHRANRFDQADVQMLQRLARAVGRMLPWLGRGGDEGLVAEPEDVLGVLLSDRRHIRDLRYAVRMLAPDAQNNLLITGPTGAGKSVLARRVAKDVLHLNGVETVVLRRGDPQMLVTQLTGARRGEFTGATDRDGAIQRCLRHKRALFLDEVQNLDDAGQQILLPLLEVRGRHFGGLTASSESIDGPLHVILGTNVDVSPGSRERHFREDLWYRMSATHMHLPPLAERGREAVYRYLRGMLHEAGAPSPEEVFQTDALHRTTTWGWPGNLRQLQVFADRAARVHASQGRPIGIDELPHLGMADGRNPTLGSVAQSGLDRAMISHVLQALESVGWVQSKAAEELRMSPSRLNKLLKRHELLDEVKRRRRELRVR